MDNQKVDLSVIILTFNEERNLAHAIDSVKNWAAEVYVVDSYSTDGTVDIALSYENCNVHVVQHKFENYSQQWNWALTHLPLNSDWTLKLDADERVTQTFIDELGRTLPALPAAVEGIYFRRLFFFTGVPLKYGGVSNNYDLRLWRTGCAHFEDRSVNEHAIVKGDSHYVRAFVEHKDCRDLSDWIAKHNRYASLEAIAIISGNLTGDVRPRFWGTPIERRIWLRKVYRRFPFRNSIYFFYRYLFRLGFLDGRAGFSYAFLHASFLYWIDLKLKEYKRTGVAPEIVWPTRGAPHPQVANSALQRAVSSEPSGSADS